MQVNFSPGTNFNAAPAWLAGVLNQVSGFFDSHFRDNITINVTLNWVPLGGAPGGGQILGENGFNGGPNGVLASSGIVSAALAAHAGNAIQSAAYSHIGYTPFGQVSLSPGEAMVTGLESAQTIDVWISVASDAT